MGRTGSRTRFDCRISNFLSRVMVRPNHLQAFTSKLYLEIHKAYLVDFLFEICEVFKNKKQNNDKLGCVNFGEDIIWKEIKIDW